MCDCLVALGPRSASRGSLFGKNSDRPPTEPQDVVWSPPRHDRGPVRTTYLSVAPASGDTLGCVLSRPRWCWGAEHGVNEAGVAVGNESIFTTLDPRPFPAALVGMDLVRLALERAATAAEAVGIITTLLERYGQGGSGHDPAVVGRAKPYWSSFLVADPTDAWVVETTGRRWEAERVEGARAISNRTTIPSFGAAHQHPRQPVAQRVDPRWNASKELLADGPLSLGGLMAHLRRHDAGSDGWTLCMHAGGEEATTASMVAELDPAGHQRAWMLLGAPCRSIYVPVTVGEPFTFPVWERFAAPPPTDGELDALRDLERAFLAAPPGTTEALGSLEGVLARTHGSRTTSSPGSMRPGSSTVR